MIEVWQELAYFSGTVPEGVELNEFIGGDNCVEVTPKLTNAEIVSEFISNYVKDVAMTINQKIQ